MDDRDLVLSVEGINQASDEDLLKPLSCGCLPLFHALNHRVSLDIVRLLIDRAPGVLVARNDHGNIALSFVRSSTSLEVAMLVAERTPPSALLELDGDGDLPLNCILQNGARGEVLRLTIERCPPEAFVSVNKLGRLLIHDAARVATTPLEVLQMLIDRSPPDALVTADKNGCLPMHYSVTTRNMPLEVVENLLRYTPKKAFSLMDNYGRTPLHRALHYCATSPKVVAMLIEASSFQCLCLALHAALGGVPPDRSRTKEKHEIIQLLLSRCPPEAYTTIDANGRHPLHCLKNMLDPDRFVDVIRVLIDRSPPQALLQRDSQGRLPLHADLEAGSVSINILDLLMKPPHSHASTTQDLLFTADNKGRLPLHSAVLAGGEVVINFLLNRVRPYCTDSMLATLDKGGRTPLHCLLKSKKTSRTQGMVDLLIGSSPHHPLSIADSLGQLPIHTALASRANIDMVDSVLQCSAEHAFSTADNFGRLPLVYAIRSGYDGRVLHRLIDQARCELHAKPDQDGKIMMHYINRNTPADVTLRLVEAYPELLLVPDNSGRLPIHYTILQRGVSLANIEILMDRYPESLLVPDRDGRLPVHLLVKKRKDIVRMLVARSGPEALLAPDSNLSLPLHRALLHNSSFHIVKELVNLNHEALLFFDKDGHLPLYYALASSQRSQERKRRILQLLIERSPVSLSTVDPFGRLPLHDALDLGAPLSVVESMIQLHPDAARQADHDGRLPLHCALEKRSSWNVVQVVLHAYPGAVNWSDKRNRLALYIAGETSASLDIIFTLARLAPSILVDALRQS